MRTRTIITTKLQPRAQRGRDAGGGALDELHAKPVAEHKGGRMRGGTRALLDFQMHGGSSVLFPFLNKTLHIRTVPTRYLLHNHLVGRNVCLNK